MKKIIILVWIIFTSLCLFSEERETAEPTFGVDIYREVAYAEVNGKTYYLATVELKAAAIDDLFVEGVKVIVRNQFGNIVYRKRFSKSYVYVFEYGDNIQVGKGNASTQVILRKTSIDDKWVATIKEKGIY